MGGPCPSSTRHNDVEVGGEFRLTRPADIDKDRILRINGFGRVSADALLAWRRTVEGKFRFDPNEPVAAADVARIKGNMASRRADLHSQIQESLDELRDIAADVRKARARPPPEALKTWNWMKQEEFDERLVNRMPLEFLCLIGVISLMLIIGYYYLFSG